MKRLLLLLLALLFLALPALADRLPGFDDHIMTLSALELSDHMETALTVSDLAGAEICVDAQGVPVIVMDEYTAYAVALRKDGLMTLCCFRPNHGEMALEWHNDLLLSHLQSISLSTQGAVWSGGALPEMTLVGDKLLLWIPLQDGNTQLQLTASDFYDSWRVTEIALYGRSGVDWQPLLILPDNCLSDDIRLSHCYPGDWNASDDPSW